MGVMITINLLPWREELRRKRRRYRLLALGGGLSLILMIAWVAHVWMLQDCGVLRQRLSVLSSLHHRDAANQEKMAALLSQQVKKLVDLRQQQVWREGFACQLRWLDRLGGQLPIGCLVHKVAVKDNQLLLVVVARQGLLMKELTAAVASIREWQQVRVRQVKSDGQTNLIKIEFNAQVHCSDRVK